MRQGTKKRQPPPSRRDREMFAAYNDGETQLSIAERFNVDKNTVHRALKRCGKIDAHVMFKDVARLRVRQIGQYDHLWREAMTSWEASKRQEITVTTTDKEDGKTRTVRRRQQYGDPALLLVAIKALEGQRSAAGICDRNIPPPISQTNVLIKADIHSMDDNTLSQLRKLAYQATAITRSPDDSQIIDAESTETGCTSAADNPSNDAETP
mgnify:CR=1 FL=1